MPIPSYNIFIYAAAALASAPLESLLIESAQTNSWMFSPAIISHEEWIWMHLKALQISIQIDYRVIHSPTISIEKRIIRQKIIQHIS